MFSAGDDSSNLNTARSAATVCSESSDYIGDGNSTFTPKASPRPWPSARHEEGYALRMWYFVISNGRSYDSLLIPACEIFACAYGNDYSYVYRLPTTDGQDYAPESEQEKQKNTEVVVFIVVSSCK